MLGDDAGDDDDERAGRPPIWMRDPPSSDTMKPPTMAV